MIWALLVGILIGGVFFFILDEVYDLRKISALMKSADDRMKVVQEYHQAVVKLMEQNDVVYAKSVEVFNSHSNVVRANNELIELYRKEWYANRNIKVD